MPRGGGSRGSSRGRGGFGRRSPSPSSPPRQAFTATRPIPTQAQPQQKSGGLFSGIGSTIMTGMAFGAGSEVAHQAVRAVTGGSSQH